MADEYFDLLDSDGNKTGQKKLRTLVHRDGDWHRGIHAWLMNDKGQFLLQKRSANKDSNPGKWTRSITGHVVSGDDSIATVITELQEELGLGATPDDIEYLFTSKKETVMNNGTFLNNEFDDVYLIRLNPNLDSLTLQKEEVSEVKFISVGELKSLLMQGSATFVAEPQQDQLFVEFLQKVGLLSS